MHLGPKSGVNVIRSRGFVIPKIEIARIEGEARRYRISSRIPDSRAISIWEEKDRLGRTDGGWHGSDDGWWWNFHIREFCCHLSCVSCSRETESLRERGSEGGRERLSVTLTPTKPRQTERQAETRWPRSGGVRSKWSKCRQT